MTHYRFFFGGHCTISRPFARTICSNDRDHHGRTLEQLHHSRSPDLPPQSSQKYVERPFRGEVLSPWSGHHAKSPLRAALPLHRAGPTGGAGTPASWSSPGADPLSQCAAALSLSLSLFGVVGWRVGLRPCPNMRIPRLRIRGARLGVILKFHLRIWALGGGWAPGPTGFFIGRCSMMCHTVQFSTGTRNPISQHK